MRSNIKYLMLTLAFVLAIQVAFSQSSFKPGDRAEAFVNNVWQEVKIVKPGSKVVLYEVESVTSTGKSSSVISVYQVKEENIRALRQTDAIGTTANKVTSTNVLSYGSYRIYSGIPFMYIGHFELKEDGTYAVALSSDEDSYAYGTYTYNASANTIEWKTGFFWQKKWAGKITGQGNNTHIEFSRSTYADNKQVVSNN